WCLMRDHAHVVVVPCQERSLACTFRRRALQFSVKVAGNLWQERFHSYPMDERKGLEVTHERLCFLRLLSSVRSDCRVDQFNLRLIPAFLLNNPCRLPPCKSHFPLFLSA